MKKEVINPKAAKSKEYKDVLSAIAKTEKCPFCKKNFKYHKNPILKKKDNWFITESSWPYKNSKYHFLIILETHKEEFNQLSPHDFNAVSKLINWAIRNYKIKGGALTLRFGDPLFTGATVYHLHFHLIVPKINKKNKRVETVYFPIG